jgi:hypothetical protein
MGVTGTFHIDRLFQIDRELLGLPLVMIVRGKNCKQNSQGKHKMNKNTFEENN